MAMVATDSNYEWGDAYNVGGEAMVMERMDSDNSLIVPPPELHGDQSGEKQGSLHSLPQRRLFGDESQDPSGDEHLDFHSDLESQDYQPVGVESEGLPMGASSTSGVMMSKINAFNDQREEERKRMYHAVLWVFKVMVICGQSAFIPSIVFNALLQEIYIAKVIAIFGYTFTACSIVVLSTCPLDLLSLDDLAKKTPITFAVFNLALAVVALMRVRDYFPHLDVIAILIGLANAISVLAWRRLPSWWPAPTTFLTSWLVVMLVNFGSQTIFAERNKMDLEQPAAYSIGGFYFLCAILVFTMWQRRIHRSRSSDRKNARGMAFYEAMYFCIMAEGISQVAQGVVMSLGEDPLLGVLESIIGVCLFTPPALLLLLGRTRLFNIVGRSFDRDGARLRRDGAFIAELLDNIPVNVGQLWWVHREVEDERYEPSDPRRKWQQGHVTAVVNDKEFVVQMAGSEAPTRQSSKTDAPRSASKAGHTGTAFLEKPHPTHSVPNTLTMLLPSSNKGGKKKEDLLLQAQNNMRCVDFENLTPDLMYRVDSRNKPELQAKWHGLSRPVRAGEVIDYFMSNSWYDDPETKWQKLCEVAESHRRRHGRYPTIWLDKLCIDQTSITDGLKVLPVNVMACRKLLALCGDTYLSRLWCIWELFTLFAFVTEAAALDRIEFVFLGDQEDGIDMLRGLSSFHVKDSHCYDPNEEARLRQVIEAVGTERFNQRISSMAALTCKRLELQQMKIGKMKSMTRSHSITSLVTKSHSLTSLRRGSSETSVNKALSMTSSNAERVKV